MLPEVLAQEVPLLEEVRVIPLESGLYWESAQNQ